MKYVHVSDDFALVAFILSGLFLTAVLILSFGAFSKNLPGTASRVSAVYVLCVIILGFFASLVERC
jgi:sugar phosphate permease